MAPTPARPADSRKISFTSAKSSELFSDLTLLLELLQRSLHILGFGHSGEVTRGHGWGVLRRGLDENENEK